MSVCSMIYGFSWHTERHTSNANIFRSLLLHNLKRSVKRQKRYRLLFKTFNKRWELLFSAGHLLFFFIKEFLLFFLVRIIVKWNILSFYFILCTVFFDHLILIIITLNLFSHFFIFFLLLFCVFFSLFSLFFHFFFVLLIMFESIFVFLYSLFI